MPQLHASRTRLGFGLSLALLLTACTGGTPVTPGPGPGPDPQPGPGDAGVIAVNFQTAAVTAPDGFVADTGLPFDPSRGYGWVRQDSLGGTRVGLDLSANTRVREVPDIDLPSRSLIHLQFPTTSGSGGNSTPGAWEYALPSGRYAVTVSAGDAVNTDSTHQVNVEGVPAIVAFEPLQTRRFNVVTRQVDVTDGRLTIDARGGTNTKLNYVLIRPDDRPTVRTSGSVQPFETDVSPDRTISAEINTVTGGGGINPSSLTSAGARIVERVSGAVVDATVSTSGGGDVVLVDPKAPLKANTTYTFEVTDALKDVSGKSFRPFRTTFTTGALPPPSGSVSFEKVALPTSGSVSAGTWGYTAVEYGPDRKLYAANLVGEIRRFPINADGTLGTPEVIKSVQAANGGPRTIIGMKFAPESTESNLVMYVSNNFFWQGQDAPEWSSKITRLSGANLQTVQDVVVGLPRSNRDHETNGLAFRKGEPNMLYALQGSMSSLGAPDGPWGNRPERVLSAALLRIDLSKIGAGPVNVKTEDGGTYNPYAAGAPVTIFASGIRNAYDMVWHSNGQLYVPTNGSAAGGNAPARPQTLPAVCANRPDWAQLGGGQNLPSSGAINNAGVQRDYLFRVVAGGYYGHPNPARCEYTAFGGNPTAGVDRMELPEYAVGTKPDPNWRGFAYDFGEHASPNGVIEEYTFAGNSPLKNKLLVVRYSAGKDIVALTPGANGDIVSAQTRISGFTDFDPAPLDLVENPTNGHIYVAQLDQATGKGQLTLLRQK